MPVLNLQEQSFILHIHKESLLGRGPCVCVHVCVFFLHCQDVSSFGNAPAKMCHLWAGGLVCVCVCVSSLLVGKWEFVHITQCEEFVTNGITGYYAT